MKFYLPVIFLIVCSSQVLRAQELDSMYFNLYTDSLKKGTYNYINVEGHFSDGSYLPLSDKEITFTSSDGNFSRNSLFVDSSFKGEKITVKATLKKNPRFTREIVIYIKKNNNNERLPTYDEIMNSSPDTRKKRKPRR